MKGEGGFSDGKDAGALRTIGELCDALGLKAHVLRYWEEQFPQLKPLKRSGGRRYYRPEDVAMVREIDRLVNSQGYTLRGARTALKDFPGNGQRSGSFEETSSMSALQASPGTTGVSADTIARLRAIRGRLAEALAS